jgi:hypothetical protein
VSGTAVARFDGKTFHFSGGMFSGKNFATRKPGTGSYTC